MDEKDRYLISTVGVGAGFFAACLAVGFILVWHRTGIQTTDKNSQQGPIQVIQGPMHDWPTLGGSAGHTGLAPGSLPDRLSLAWRFGTGGPVLASAAIVGGKVYVGSSDGTLYCLDLVTGSKIWAYRASDAIEAAITVVDNRVYFGSKDGWFYAVTLKGSLVWRYQAGGRIAGGAGWLEDPIRILIGSYDGSLYCLDPEDGKLIWSYKTNNYINGTPTAWNNTCIIGGCDAHVYIISADGTGLASIDSGSYIAGSVAAKDGYAYVGNYDGTLLKIDVSTAEVIWTYRIQGTPILTCPAIADGLLLFGARDSRLYCLRDQDGTKVWEFVALGNIDSSPVVCDQKVVFGSDDGRLYMVRLTDGTLIWSYQIGKPISASPAIASGVVVVGSDDGNVYAFGSTNK